MAFNLIYANQGSIRNQQLKAELARLYEQAALKAGIDSIRVVSGGQDATGSHRTGSHRHDLGGAGDIQLLRGGRVLDFTNKDDLPYFENFVREARGLGITGIGAGSDYMGNTTIHAGFGSPAVWGAGGKGANAPQWLRNAYGSRKGVTLNTAPGTPADPEAPAEIPGVQDIIKGLGGGGGTAEPSAGIGLNQISPSGLSEGSGSAISSQAAALMAALMESRRNRYGLSLTGMAPNV